MKSLVILPTYNEIENIQMIIPSIFAACPEVEILVVDDSSPDGTGNMVKSMQKNTPKLHLLSRAKKQGLGKAYLAGFAWGLANNFDFLIEMDADFSHPPISLQSMLTTLKTGNDFAIGSRYVAGGKTLNWGFWRRFISKGGGVYSRFVLGYPIQDWTGGFNGWTRKVIEKIGLDNVKSEGYSFQIELKYRASKLGFKGQEFPITFEDRRVGQSKMSIKIVLEAFYRVWFMRAG